MPAASAKPLGIRAEPDKGGIKKTYFCAIILVAVIGYQWFQMAVQQRVIKDLNDRLMSRSFTEYATVKAREDPPPELETRSPLSWYDDPNVVDGEKA